MRERVFFRWGGSGQRPCGGQENGAPKEYLKTEMEDLA